MRSPKRVFLAAVLALLVAGPLAASAAHEPVNSCIIIPEIMNEREASAPQAAGGSYQPDSCITRNTQALRPAG